MARNGNGNGSTWEMFTGQRRRVDPTQIGISRNKRLLIPPELKSKLGDSVQLWFNKKDVALRIKAANKGADNSYPVRKNEQQNQYSVSLAALFGHYGLEPKATKYFPVTSEDDSIVVHIGDNMAARATSEPVAQ